VTIADELEALILVARKHGLLTLKAGDIEFTLGAQPYASALPVTSTAAPDDDRCKCGHSKGIEHNIVGECLYGCSFGACLAEKEIPSDG
jgi:hypothetical protein